MQSQLKPRILVQRTAFTLQRFRHYLPRHTNTALFIIHSVVMTVKHCLNCTMFVVIGKKMLNVVINQ